MRQTLLAATVMLASPVLAQTPTWEPLTGADIAAALTDRTLQYETAWQRFSASGRTLYNAGRDSWGYWQVQGDQYCSLWPPQDLWACYDMERSGDKLRFVGESAGDVTEGVYRDED